MSKKTPLLKPPSLSQLFDAPEGYIGNFGWVCGYAADASFLNDAVERFVRQTQTQRAYLGKIAISLVLDPKNPQISHVDVPGVYHLPFHSISNKPFRLLHAKTALLGFRAVNDPSIWKLRIIVTTGNWTRASLEQNLDLVWFCDLDKSDIQAGDVEARQIRADVKTIWDIIVWTRQYYDTRIFTTLPTNNRVTESIAAHNWFESTLNSISTPRGITSRVFDNRRRSLLKQLPELIGLHCSEVTRNYIGMGSGFFEAPQNANHVPSVLIKIMETLQGNGLITKEPEVDIFVNPRGCQAVAKSLKAINDRGWVVREAGKPEFFGAGEIRSLHAKFLFSANSRDKSASCSSPWVYLGSGNLTGPGFTEPMSKNGGNLEVGVIISPGEIFWYSNKSIPAELVISNILPVQWITSFSNDATLLAGEDFVLPDEQYVAPPVPFLLWCPEADQNILILSESPIIPIDLIYGNDQKCERLNEMQFIWIGDRPRQVQIQWNSDDGKVINAFIPVIDEYGRISATKLSAMDIDEAWRSLDNFPMPPNDEDLADDPTAFQGESGNGYSDTTERVAEYPIRRMMQLIENIASKQTAVSAYDWNAWCIRFEQSLSQAAENSVIEVFRTIGLNPLSPLMEAPFRPSFAETNQTTEGMLYEDVLMHVAQRWKVIDLKPLGAEG